MEKLGYAPPEETDPGRYPVLALASALAAWAAVPGASLFGDAWVAVTFPLLSSLAIGFGIRGRQMARPRSAGRGRATVAVWMGGAQLGLFALALLILPQLGRPREPAQRVKCASNLRQIGHGIQIYADEHGGAFPPSLDILLMSGDLTSEVFVCPSTDQERATGPTTQAVIADFRADPAHCSYLYVGGLTFTTATAAHVLAYEHGTNHKRQGMNVLYGDGIVNWLDARSAEHLLSELNAGHNPPRQLPPMPATRADTDRQ